MQTRIPTEWTEHGRRLAGVILREPFQKRSWAELLYFLVSFPLAWASVFVLVAFGVVGGFLSVVFVGVVILAVGLRLARAAGAWQRAIGRHVLGEEVAEPDGFRPRPGLMGWLRSAYTDRPAWLAVVYLAAKIPLGLIGVWFALSVWFEAIIGLASPLTGQDGASHFGVFGRLIGPDVGGPGPGPATRIGLFLTGFVFLFVAPWTMRLVVYADRRLMQLFLGPDAASSRVRSLEQSRSKALDAATETLRGIERNLHDGTQAQLVALAMRLGQAKEKLDGLAPESRTADMEAIRDLVDQAHRGAKEAITDLRDLARGIHPPALDTGLENALATLAARSPVPTELTVMLQARLAPAIETITYFCAAELLANVAQHADATRATLSCAQHGPFLRIVVRDNGRGGASVQVRGSASSGLAGLADRVGAVDGHLSLASPVGGPTVVTVDLPCHSSS